MTATAKDIRAVLATLDGSIPDLTVLDEGLTILAADLRRMKRDDYRSATLGVRDGFERQLVLSRSNGGTLFHLSETADRDVVVASADDKRWVAISDVYRDAATGGAITIPAHVARHHGMPADADIRWTWAEVAPRLADYLRRIRTRVPKPALCERCKREFFP